MKIFLIVLCVLVLAVIGFVIYGAWVLYRALYPKHEGVDYLEIYTTKGKFREDVFPKP